MKYLKDKMKRRYYRDLNGARWLGFGLAMLSVFILSGCGFEDNLPCRSDECENNPEELPKSEDEG